MASSMSKARLPAPPAAFTPAERDYIRRELDMFFSTLPSVAEGFQLKTWRGGPQAGQPKLWGPAGHLPNISADPTRSTQSAGEPQF